MDNRTLAYIIIIAALVITLFFASSKCSWKCQNGPQRSNENFSVEDQQAGKKALENLKNVIDSGADIPDMTDEELSELSDNILLVKLPNEDTKENVSFFHSENTRYWPQYYYSFPYNYKYGGAWPPGMYSRLYFWSPGYYTGSGWSYYMRPGIGYKYWPRNRWIRHTSGGKQTYYYLGNRDDYVHSGTADYNNIGLQYLG